MNPVNLTYIIATRNKLAYLRPALEKLMSYKKSDEEIFVADGASTDGTKEYLEELKQSGKIEFYLSEPDYGLAHALNKLVLASNGTLLKYITDDDAFDYGVINRCKIFILEHPEIDMLNTEGGSLNDPLRAVTETDPLQVVRALNYENSYREWQKNHTPFFFCDLGMMLRRSALPVIGLWNPIFPGPDIELSLRVSNGRANIAWYTGYSWVNISNPQSVSIVHMKRTKELTERLVKLYFDRDPSSFIVQKMGALYDKLRSGFHRRKSSAGVPPFASHWPELINISERWLTIKNTQKEPEFLWNKN